MFKGPRDYLIQSQTWNLQPNLSCPANRFHSYAHTTSQTLKGLFYLFNISGFGLRFNDGNVPKRDENFKDQKFSMLRTNKDILTEHDSMQGRYARKVISELYASFVLQRTVSGRYCKHKTDVTARHGIHLSHKKSKKYSGHRNYYENYQN